MQWTCLLVDLKTGSDLAQTWREQTADVNFAAALSVTTTQDEALAMLHSGGVLVLVVVTDECTTDVQALLKAFQINVGCIAEFQAIISDQPSPILMAGVYEFGVEQFLSRATWATELAAITHNALKLVSDPTTAEAKTVALSRSIRSADQTAIHKAEQQLGDLVTYDFRAAYAKGKALEATGDFAQATEVFGAAQGMNKMFRPAASSLGETLLITGRTDEAIEVFKKLELSNPHDVERKASLAVAYVEKGDFVTAQQYVQAADKMAPGHSRVLEAQAQVLLSTGKVGEAFKLLDGMSEVGPFFAAKLNELGIKLSQAGKGQNALALYQKAHKIVRPELRYKISLNAALACMRLKSWDMGLKYLARCEKEYGGVFPKLKKIRDAITTSKKQEAAALGAKNGDKPPLDEAG